MNPKVINKALAATLSLAGAGAAQADEPTKDAIIQALTAELAMHQDRDARTARDLATFDTLDFDVYSNQQWDRLAESHAPDILVHYPDGHTTTGLDAHIEELKWIFTIAPDTRITDHPVRFGDGEWTGVTGVFEGTFTKDMVTPDGTVIPATGKTFKMTMVTIGHWTEAGVMDEEFLFWDNQAFMAQIGLAG